MALHVDLQAYRTMVRAAMDEAIRTGNPVTFGNTGPAHASVVLEVMIANAAQHVDVVSGFADRSVWRSDNIRNALARHGNLTFRVLLDELTDTEVPTGSALADIEPNARLQVKRLSKPLGVHLCVVDSAHVRLESLQQTHEAAVTFGDPKHLGKVVQGIFDSLWRKVEHKPLLLPGVVFGQAEAAPA